MQTAETKKPTNESQNLGKKQRISFRLPHQTGLYANPRFYCDGKLIAIAIDLKPYIEARKARLDRKKNH